MCLPPAAAASIKKKMRDDLFVFCIFSHLCCTRIVRYSRVNPHKMYAYTVCKRDETTWCFFSSLWALTHRVRLVTHTRTVRERNTDLSQYFLCLPYLLVCCCYKRSIYIYVNSIRVMLLFYAHSKANKLSDGVWTWKSA